MRRIQVLTFGAITEITGKKCFEFENSGTTDALRKRLESEFPLLRNMIYAIAVDKTIISENVALPDDATVALLPPFSGG